MDLLSKDDLMRFYTPRQIYLASFVGSPIAAAWFFSRNYAAMSERSKGIRAIWMGLLATILLFVISTYLPEKFPNTVLPIAWSCPGSVDRLVS